MVGVMPTSLVNGNCNSIIKENMIPVKIEVCGLENVSLSAVKEF